MQVLASVERDSLSLPTLPGSEDLRLFPVQQRLAKNYLGSNKAEKSKHNKEENTFLYEASHRTDTSESSNQEI